MPLTAAVRNIVAAAASLALVLGCQPSQTARMNDEAANVATSTADPTKPPRDTTCPKLLDGLRSIADSPDPIAAADATKLERQGDRVQVELRTTASDAYLTSTYNLTIDLRSPLSPHVVVFAPVSSLCALSNDPLIERVQLLERPRIGPPFRPGL